MSNPSLHPNNESSGLIGRTVEVTKNGGSFFYSYKGICLAYYIEPNPMGDDRLGAAIHVACDDGQVRNLHMYPGLTEIKILLKHD